MNETVASVSNRESAPTFEMSYDSAMLFRLSLELYRGKPLSDRTREYLDSTVPAPAVILIVEGKRYLHPDHFESVPISVVHNSVIENKEGIYRRRLGDRTDGPIRGNDLCASLIGKNMHGEDIAAGILCPGGWEYDGCIHDGFYSLLSQLRNFYSDFTESKTVARILSPEDSYVYVIDPVELTVIASALPRFHGDGDSLNRQRYRANSIIEELLDNNLQVSSDKLSDSKFKNLRITRFELRDHQYLLVSFELHRENATPEEDSDSMFRLFAHRINNKLAALQTASDQLVLQEGNIIDSDDLILTEVIKTESEMVGLMVRRLGEFCKCSKQEKERFDLRSAVASAVNRVLERYPNGKVDFKRYDSELFITGDFKRLEKAVEELVDNAVYESRPVRVTMTADEEIRISIYNDLDPKGIKIMTSGSFDPFEPFRTTHNEKAGLGLNIARRIVSGHGGRIEIYEENNTGIRCDICFRANS